MTFLCFPLQIPIVRWNGMDNVKSSTSGNKTLPAKSNCESTLLTTDRTETFQLHDFQKQIADCAYEFLQ